MNALRVSSCCALALAACLFTSSLLDAQSSDSIRISETGLRATVGSGSVSLSVPIANSGARSVAASLRVDLLNPEDAILSSRVLPVQLPPGLSARQVLLPVTPDAERDGGLALIWSRVAYRLSVEGSGLSTQGVVSLGAIAPELFVLRLASTSGAPAGVGYQVRVHAINPVTRRPVAGVEVSGELTPDAGGHGMSAGAARTTDSAGEAVLRWPAGGSRKEGGAEVVVRGRKGGQRRDASVPIWFWSTETVVVSTDKRLYQPGQALHVRALLFDGKRRAVSGGTVQFTLREPNNAMLFRAKATTNSFGIASVDWRLPDSVRLGDYRLSAELAASSGWSGASGGTTVRVARYDLPTFTVSISPDRPYYVTGQEAVLAIDARYLFGRALSGGTVRVVRELQRRWNYATQGWMTEEEDSQTAELDANGHATVKLPLATISRLLEDGSRIRYRDVTCATYVTDRSTGRTEQRRTTLRVSRDPIHVYLSGVRRVDRAVRFYVTASYADGSPAVVGLRVSQRGSKGTPTVLRTLRTNRFGTAKVARLELADETGDPDARLVVEASDKAGNHGSDEMDLGWVRQADIEVDTDKTVYRPGEPVIVSVAASEATRVTVDAVRDGNTLWSTQIGIRGGHGFSVMPYREQFQGLISLVAYSTRASDDRIAASARTIAYPHDEDLRVNVRPARRDYAPGDDFRAAISVRSPEGTPAASALGVTIVDKAVEERAREDEEFRGETRGFWDWNWWRNSARVGDFTSQDLARLDVSREIPEDVDLAAEVLLCSDWVRWDFRFQDNWFESAIMTRFHQKMEAQLSGVRSALRASPVLPSNDEELQATLDAAGIRQDTLTDPWDTRYAFRYGLDVRNRTVVCTSAGPDKQPDTPDDMEALTVSWNHFTPIGVAIDAAVKRVHDQSGGHVPSLDALVALLRDAGIDADGLRDPWGVPYQLAFEVSGSIYRLLVRSTRTPERTDGSGPGDVVWTSSIDYFERPRQELERVYAAYFEETGQLPRTDADIDAALRRAGFNLRDLRDPWGHAYFVAYYQTFEYGQELTYAPNTPARPINAVTTTIDHVSIMSAGPDGIRGTPDDFRLATTSRTVAVQSGRDSIPRGVSSVPVSDGAGAIEGVVLDTQGGRIPGVKLECRLENGGEEQTRYATTTDARGRFLLPKLPVGAYRLQATLEAFRTLTVRFVPVQSGIATPLNLTLEAGAISETVTVVGASPTLQTQYGERSFDASPARIASLENRTFTPRVRQYFPETLYWAPAITTGPGGSATVAVKLADTITTWKMAVIASTATGEVGFAEAEVEAFQPFFVEHDPPKVLTAGDEIDLPVVVRNYLGQPAQTTLDLSPASWFALRGAASQTVAVPAGEFATAYFPMTATAVVADGRQRVTATSGAFGDAVDRSVRVHPDGEERQITTGGLLRDAATLKVELPENLVAGSAAGTVRIYPDLLAHLVEGIEGALARPYGCGEQTISAAYPSVMLLKYFKAAGISGTQLARRAESYARMGVERLLGFKSADGGFGYWGPMDPDPALTAYAVRFLTDASEVVRSDDQAIARAVDWLVAHQEADGTWKPRSGDVETPTASIASALAHSARRLPNEPLRARANATVRAALRSIESARQPYSMAHLALAAWDTGLKEQAGIAVAKLKAAALTEGPRTYWALESNTPFYGWGLTGRIESTAAAVQALTAVEGDAARSLIDRGLAFLLSAKDRYGVWYSGHASMEVLSALLDQLAGQRIAPGGSRATVAVNGRPAIAVDLPRGSDGGPVIADIGRFLGPGVNTIEIKQSVAGAAYASVQAASIFYVPWTRGPELRETIETGESRGLRLLVDYDTTSSRVGETIRASVAVERFGHRGYGMLLAEVGLPPGADVDRASLERAVGNAGWDLCRYEVQPDRVVFYVWPRAGGTRFSFEFRPRFALTAKAAASTLYDYYNPEEQATLPPATFTVLPSANPSRSPR